jgi:hypothetical protein
MKPFALLIPATTTAAISRQDLRMLLAASPERQWRIANPGESFGRAPRRSISLAAAWSQLADRGLDIRSVELLPPCGQYTPTRWRVEIGLPLPAPDDAWI